MIDGPLALIVTPETVKSVRFGKRLSQTPVSLRRLLRQVKERRLVEREEGKRTGAVGQLMNWKEVREEREERAVMERERSAEQLESRRERRWRNGLAASQTVALWREGG